MSIPAQEAHVVRVFDVVETGGTPLSDDDVLAALGASGDLRTAEIELFDLSDLQDMPLSTYLSEGHGIADSELDGMRGQLDGLKGRVLILPSRAFGGEAMTLEPRGALRLVGRFAEDVAPVSFGTLPAGGAQGATGEGDSPGGQQPGMRRAALVLLGLLIGAAVLVAVLAGLA
jgi:hypothetical protein